MSMVSTISYINNYNNVLIQMSMVSTISSINNYNNVLVQMSIKIIIIIRLMYFTPTSSLLKGKYVNQSISILILFS